MTVSNYIIESYLCKTSNPRQPLLEAPLGTPWRREEQQPQLSHSNASSQGGEWKSFDLKIRRLFTHPPEEKTKTEAHRRIERIQWWFGTVRIPWLSIRLASRHSCCRWSSPISRGCCSTRGLRRARTGTFWKKNELDVELLKQCLSIFSYLLFPGLCLKIVFKLSQGWRGWKALFQLTFF